MRDDILDRAAGVLLGAACGDALGVPYEFARPLGPGETPEMKGGGLGPYEPGEYSDDTQMAACIARAAATGADLCSPETLDDIANAFLDWAVNGASDIGSQTAAVLGHAEQLIRDHGMSPALACKQASQKLYAQTGRAAGNGSLMRTAIVSVAYLNDEDAMVRAVRAISELTHADPLAGDACVLWCAACRDAVLSGELNIEPGLKLLPDERRGRWRDYIAQAARESPDRFAPNGFVVTALQAAWSAICHAGPGEPLVEGLYAAVRAGDDTDTVAAIAGAALGACHGSSAIPREWLAVVHGWPGLDAAALSDLSTRTARYALDRR